MPIEAGFEYRDLNKNGRLDPCENPRLPIEVRVEDLLRPMTLEENAGLMMYAMIMLGDFDTASPYQVNPGDNFEHYMLPFEPVFAAKVQQVMPTTVSLSAKQVQRWPWGLTKR